MQLISIPKNEQEGMLSSFWAMLKECETQADNENDPLLKHGVAQWYQQWNRVAQDHKEPVWVTREKRTLAELQGDTPSL